MIGIQIPVSQNQIDVVELYGSGKFKVLVLKEKITKASYYFSSAFKGFARAVSLLNPLMLSLFPSATQILRVFAEEQEARAAALKSIMKGV